MIREQFQDGEIDPSLSAHGVARRHEILGVVLGAQRRRRIRRRASTVALAAAPLAILACWAAFSVWNAPAPQQPIAHASPHHHDPDAVAPRHEVAAERDDEREASTQTPTRITTTRITDGELLALLAEAGRPDGLVRVGNQTMLASEFARVRSQGSAQER